MKVKVKYVLIIVQYSILRIAQKRITLRHCATAPLRHCATASLRHCATAPLRHCATASLRHCVTAPLRHCVTASLRHYATASLRHCATAPLRHCATASLRHCAPLWDIIMQSGYKIPSRDLNMKPPDDVCDTKKFEPEDHTRMSNYNNTS